MLTIIKVMKRLDDLIGVIKQITDHHHHAPFRDSLCYAMQHGTAIRILTRLRLVELLQNPPHLTRPAARTHKTPHLLIKSRQAHRISLLDKQIRQRGCQMFRVCQLRERHTIDLRRLIARVFHRARDIHHHHRPQVGLLDVLLDHMTITFRHHLPVEILWIITRRILAVLRKFCRKPLVRRAMPTAQCALHPLPRIPFQAPHHPHRLLRQKLHAIRQFQGMLR